MTASFDDLVSLLPQRVVGEQALQDLAASMAGGALESVVEDLPAEDLPAEVLVAARTTRSVEVFLPVPDSPRVLLSGRDGVQRRGWPHIAGVSPGRRLRS